MSMNRTSPYRSPCEILRKINDMFQGDTELDKRIRRLLAESESKAKDMSTHLSVYEPKYFEKWDLNKEANRDDAFRSRKEYKYDKI